MFQANMQICQCIEITDTINQIVEQEVIETKEFCLCTSRYGSPYLFVQIKMFNIKTVMSTSILLTGRPVKLVNTKTEEAGCEEAVGEGQHPGVHVPHHC